MRADVFGGAKVGPVVPTCRGRTTTVELTRAVRSYYNAATIPEANHTNK
jgi:hypothetical protein